MLAKEGTRQGGFGDLQTNYRRGTDEAAHALGARVADLGAQPAPGEPLSFEVRETGGIPADRDAGEGGAISGCAGRPARSEIAAARADLSAPLNVIHLKDRRKDRWLKFAASVILGMFLLAAAIIAFMRWRGQI